MKIESTFANATLRISETICLYITCWIIISICAKILYILNKNIQNFFKKEQKVELLEKSMENREGN